MGYNTQMDRRGFLGRALGALTVLPILGRTKTALPARIAAARLKGLIVPLQLQTADMGLVASQHVSMSPLTVLKNAARFQPDDTEQYIVHREAGFGVIYYLDPRGLFEEYNTDADI